MNVYELASGQQLNRVKTSLYFSSSTAHEVQEEIKSRFGAQVIKQHLSKKKKIIKQHEKYLGLPSLVRKNRKISFKEIKDKPTRKLAG